MSKLDTGYLFTLIKSLSKGEKRHFKVYSSKRILGSQNAYFRLFDEIESQKKYSEERVRQQKISRDLPTLKKRLYRAILTSLAEFHSDPGTDLRRTIAHIEILFNKSLMDHCQRQIQRAKKTARQYELYDQWLEILKWEYKVAVQTYQPRIDITKEEDRVFALLENQKKYRDATNLFVMRYERQDEKRHARHLAEMKKMLASPLLKDETQALSFQAKQNLYDCHYLFSVRQGDYPNSYRYSKKITDMYHQRPDLIPLNAFAYLLRLNNFFVACGELHRFDEMLAYIRKLEEIRKSLRSPVERTTAFFNLYHLMNYHIGTGFQEDAERDVKRIEQELALHENKLNQFQKITLYVVMSQVYFGLKNYRSSLRWLNKVASFEEIKVRTDIECFIRLFQLIVHYEAKSDPELIRSLFKSAYRFLYKQQRMYKFEAAILLFFRKYLLKDDWEQHLKKPFMELKKNLEQLSKDPNEKHALNYFDFISWLESKIEGHSFAEILKRKAKMH